MLAALRVLHVDPSNAPAASTWVEEQPFLDPRHLRLSEAFVHPTPNSNRTTRRGGGRAWSDLR